MTPHPTAGARGYRVLLALWTLAFFAARLPFVAEIYCRPVLRHPFFLNRWIGDPIPPPWLVTAAVVVLLALLLCFAAGLGARRLHLPILVLIAGLYSLDLLMLRGYGILAGIQWVLLWFAPYDRPPRADAPHPTAPRWRTEILILQLASVYVITVLAKLAAGGDWFDGSAIYTSLNGERFGLFGLSAHGIGWPAAQVLGIATLGLELFIGLGLLFRRTRPWALGALILLHLGLALSLRISPLFHLLILAHLPLFLLGRPAVHDPSASEETGTTSSGSTQKWARPHGVECVISKGSSAGPLAG